MGIVLENGKIFRNGKLQSSSLYLDEKIQNSAQINARDQIIDCTGKWILPGLIDAHVHFRVPGGEHKEDWKTGSLSAAHGGVTTVMDMPNTNPPTITAAALEQKRSIAQKDSLVRFGFHFGATIDNFAEAQQARGINFIKMYMGSSTGNLLVNNADAWKKWFKLCKERNWTTVIHAEFEPLIVQHSQAMPQNNINVHNKIRNAEVECTAIQKALELQKEIGNKLHIAHLSSKAGFELVEKAKQESENISCEVCPHHLFLTEDDLEKLGNFGKMNPPLRTKEDTHALWKGIRNGIIDCIATDHAPHTIAEKQKPYNEAPSGVPGVETMLPLLLQAVHEEKMSISDLVRCTAENPARIFGYTDRGSLEVGKLGDVVVVDPTAKYTIEAKNLHSKCGWTPFEGFKVKGKVSKTIIGGKVIVDG